MTASLQKKSENIRRNGQFRPGTLKNEAVSTKLLNVIYLSIRDVRFGNGEYALGIKVILVEICLLA